MATIAEKHSRMHNPAHPGEVLKELYMKPRYISITQAAEALGVTRKHLSNIVNAHAPVTPDMAVRLAIAFGTDPELWLNMQAQSDLWTLRRKARPRVKVLVEKKAA